MRSLTLAGLALLLLASIVASTIAGYFIFSAFRQGDCDGGCNAGELLLWTLGILGTSTLLGSALWLRSQRNFHALIRLGALIFAVTTLPTSAVYAYRLHSDKVARERSADVRTNQDYSHMLVATRDIPAAGIEAGQRCAIGTIDCERTPRELEAICSRIGAVKIPESDWPALVRLPKEDHGVPPTAAISNFPKSCRPR